jgi:type III secretion protein R
MSTATRSRGKFLRGALLLSLALSAAGTVSTVSIQDAHAQRTRPRRSIRELTQSNSKESLVSRPLMLAFALAAMALLPFLIIMVTSFVKISVVLSIVRSALGTQQMPPTQIITGLAIILTMYIMTPVGLSIYRNAQTLIDKKAPGKSLLTANSIDLAFEAIAEARNPMRKFLVRHSHVKDRAMFFSMAKRLRLPEDRQGVGPEDFSVIVPSFVISELKEAFQIGFIIFVPFLVIDMVVANILMALGMQMLSPTTISLPFKLLLFVIIDGWYLITKGLVIGYV